MKQGKKKLLLFPLPKTPGRLKPPSSMAKDARERQGFDGEMSASQCQPRKPGRQDNGKDIPNTD